MRIAILIPARFESTRLPGKMLLDSTGRPLIVHTAERAAEARALAPDVFGDVVVAADDGRVVRAVEEWNEKLGLNARAVMTDPAHKSGSDRIAEAAAGLPPEYDAVVNLQGDEPDLPAGAVVGLARYYRESSFPMDIATLVYPITDAADRRNPALVKAVLGAGGRALYFSRADIPFRREDAAPSYGHVGIYLYKRSALERFVALPEGVLERTEKLEQLRALENGMTIGAMVLAERPAKGVDTPEDYDAFVRARS